jgi:hypothetical protein
MGMILKQLKGKKMGHRCFISFKTEDSKFKEDIQNNPNVDMIDHSLNEAIDSDDEDYVMRKIREDYLADSTVTIHLIGSFSSEKMGKLEQRFIKRELQASLYNGVGNTRNGILGVVLPHVVDSVYQGSYSCSNCFGSHNYVGINDSTVVKEFSVNYFIPEANKCSWSENDRYCVLVPWDIFIADPNVFIDQSFEKRSQSVANKVKVFPK